MKIIHASLDNPLAQALAEGESLWLDREELERATGWKWKESGLCRDEVCLPVPRSLVRSPGPAVGAGARLDVAGLWRRLGWPLARARDVWVLGESVDVRREALGSLEAPDFALPDLGGEPHRLSAWRGRKVFLVVWASWCGCRGDLPLWQSLQEDTRNLGLVVVAAALDEPEAARPFIEAASLTYACLIDREHRLGELYGFTNVPQAVWIDERGRMVRPPETAGMTDAFRAMDRRTLALPTAAVAERQRAKAAYDAAVRDWAARGTVSPHVLDEPTALARLRAPSVADASAHVHFRLGQTLSQMGRVEEASSAFAEASRLHPDSWAMWRQTAEKNATGLAVSEAFWQRVDALGERPYYLPAALEQPPGGATLSPPVPPR